MNRENEKMNRTHSRKKEESGDQVKSGRREFLRKSLAATSLLAVSPSIISPLTAVAGSNPAGACDPTTRDLYGLGPFHAQGAPFRSVLALPNEPGDRLFIAGVVYANDCISPLADVLIDVWHADDDGCYSRFGDCTEVAGEDAYKLRGRMTTGADGLFAFETVRPGHYLNGSQYRPAHIHLIVKHPAAAELVTQLYFEGDPYNDIDPAASEPAAAARVIPLEQDGTGLHGIFDIILDVSPESDVKANAPVAATMLRQNHPNPVVTATRIPFQLARRSYVDLAVYDMQGRRVRSLIGRVMDQGVHAVEWQGADDGGVRLPSGVYLCRLNADGVTGVKRITIL